MRSLCPICGKAACKGHARSSKGSRRTPEQERARELAEPWRAAYRSGAYRAARAAAIAAYGGACALCGRQVFAQDRAGAWRAIVKGAGVHHVRKLSQGGAAAQAGMLPVCPACHALLDRS